jgi:hypothetical protein
MLESLPEGHQERFGVEVIDRLDLGRLLAANSGTGSRGELGMKPAPSVSEMG